MKERLNLAPGSLNRPLDKVVLAAAPAVELDDKARKALEAAAGDPEKQAKIRAALEKAARLKAEKAAANNDTENKN